ncbi:nuclear transport factor 2 family protein [Rhizobiaceae sp. 2RAB30]
MNEDIAGASRVVADYAKAFHEGDTNALRAIFLPGCVLRTVRGGALAEFPLDTWLDHVARRPSPASLGHPSEVRLRGIDFAGPDCAAAVVEMTIPGTGFVDCLQLLRIDGRWHVAGKVFHAAVLPAV